jgi:hypothetical protein
VPGGSGAHPGTDLVRRLGLVQVGVEALVADLESVDAVEEEVRPLRGLAAELRRRLGAGVPGWAEVERLRDLALAVLRAFAVPGSQAPGGPSPRVPTPGVPAPGMPTPGVPVPEPPPAPAQPRDPGFWRR